MDEKDINLFKFICKKEISTIDHFLASKQKTIEIDEDDEIIEEV